MLDKIVISKDRKEARVHFDTHSVGFYHSDGQVLQLVWEIVFEPSIRLEAYHLRKQEEYERSLEKTQEIDLQLNFFTKDAA